MFWDVSTTEVFQLVVKLNRLELYQLHKINNFRLK